MSKLFAMLIKEQADPSEFCKCTGILLLDPSAFALQLDRIMPLRWNGKVIIDAAAGSMPAQS